MAEKSWTLTDVSSDLWEENFLLSASDLGLPPKVRWSISKKTLRGGLREGVDLIEIDNGLLRYTLLPTRGMGIWRGSYRGIRLGWDAPVRGPVHPKFVNLHDRGGLGWLQGFDEWIVRCGLDSHGSPGPDVVTNNMGNPVTVDLTLHGKIANLPAHFVQVSVQTEPPYELAVTGYVQESMLFCPQLELRSTVRTWADSNRLQIDDQVVNLQSTPAELELLYHCNFGSPLLESGSKLVVPIAEMAPRDPRAAEGIRDYADYRGPTDGFVEQVYWYDLQPSESSETLALLRNNGGDQGVVLRFDKRELPCFSQWKNTGAECDGYVTGLEPGTDFPNAKSFERQQGRVVRIEPGQSHRCQLSVDVLDSQEQVQSVEKEIQRLQGTVEPRVSATPSPRFSPL